MKIAGLKIKASIRYQAALSTMRIHILFFILAAIFLYGCSHTTVGGGLGRTSPDGMFELQIQCDGANGHAYIDRTKKKVWVWIRSIASTNRSLLFEHSYTLTGSDVEWQTHWSSTEAVSVEIYDWGDGVSNYDNVGHMAASNHIALLSFVLDKSTGKFSEQK